MQNNFAPLNDHIITELSSHRKVGFSSNFLTAFTYNSQSNSKLYVQKNNYVPNSPVELAHYVGGFVWERRN